MATIPDSSDFYNPPSWITGNIWNTCKLNGRVVPGAIEVRGLSKENSTKDNKKPGESGGGVISTGVIPPKFTIIARVFNGDQETLFWYNLQNYWDEMRTFTAENAVPIEHYLLGSFGVARCWIEKISITLDRPGGALVAEFNCVSLNKPKDDASKKADGIGPGPNGASSGTTINVPQPPLFDNPSVDVNTNMS